MYLQAICLFEFVLHVQKQLNSSYLVSLLFGTCLPNQGQAVFTHHSLKLVFIRSEGYVVSCRGLAQLGGHLTNLNTPTSCNIGKSAKIPHVFSDFFYVTAYLCVCVQQLHTYLSLKVLLKFWILLRLLYSVTKTHCPPLLFKV